MAKKVKDVMTPEQRRGKKSVDDFVGYMRAARENNRTYGTTKAQRGKGGVPRSFPGESGNERKAKFYG